LLRRAVRPLRFVAQKHATTRNFSFTFAGPRTLDEIIKKDLVEDKTGAEVADVWYSYHESKVSVDASSSVYFPCSAVSFFRSLFLMIIRYVCFHVSSRRQENMLGLVLKGKEGEEVLTRATSW
jgi:hypothetical protein